VPITRSLSCTRTHYENYFASTHPDGLSATAAARVASFTLALLEGTDCTLGLRGDVASPPRPTAIQSLNCTRLPRAGRAWLPISPALAACDRAPPLSWGCLARLSARRGTGLVGVSGTLTVSLARAAGARLSKGEKNVSSPSSHTELGGLAAFQARVWRPLNHR